MFYGANCLQVYPSDNIYHKAVVAAAWTTDTAHQILGAVMIWQYLISNFGNYKFLSQNNVPQLMTLICSVIVSTIAQLFLTRRIWQLSGRIWVFPAFLIPASVSQLVFVSKVLTMTDITTQSFYALTPYATAVYTMAAVTDVSIAVIMCTLLARERRGFKRRTDVMLARLIILSVNSGLWTAVFALFTAAVATQKNLIFDWPQFCMSPLYCNTILGCLNARDFIQNGIHREGDDTSHLGPSLSVMTLQGSSRSSSPSGDHP
ncbi:hypothetical protein K503DRAFT_767251 [Rhizopogon vinicolor AM-OR11-026]|uniref:DUF6534 domain-containing protein n=1 Tax=Rhizopogon vinicolor AM-OR11-026 TaxID=1314800 RepID=A0A1B7NAI5_9AGAM|nr:hypothetical protein K503DRAFT_767251 [Rhizopogon vinicolor AM-OR11-026]